MFCLCVDDVLTFDLEFWGVVVPVDKAIQLALPTLAWLFILFKHDKTVVGGALHCDWERVLSSLECF